MVYLAKQSLMGDGVEGFLKIKYLEISLEAMVKISGKVFNSDN